MNYLKYGIVSEVKKGFVRVKFDEDDGIVSDWLPVMVRKSKTEKHSWQLEVNEHVVCLMDKHVETGVVLGAIPNDEDTPDPGEAAGKCRILFSDGTLFEYNVNTGKMKVDVKGDLEATTTGKCTVDAGTELEANAGTKATVQAPTIELTGSVKITGPLLITGPTTAAAITAGAISAAGLAIAPGGTMGMQDGTPLQASGDIHTTGEIVANEVKAGIVALSTHKHTAPSGGGPTSTPIP